MKEKIDHTHKRLIIIIIGITCVFSVFTQEMPAPDKSNFEISIGINTLGPVTKMRHLMKEYGFDEDADLSWFGGGLEHYPQSHPWLGFAAMISYNRMMTLTLGMGFQLNAAFLRQIVGHPAYAGFLEANFSSIYAVLPVFSFNQGKKTEIQTGLAMMLNSCNLKSAGNNIDIYRKFSIGMLGGIRKKIWDHRLTYGVMGIQLLLAKPNKIGPVVFESYNPGVSDPTIPESNYGFGHLSLNLTMGFHQKLP